MELPITKEVKIHQAVPCLSIVLPTHRYAPNRRTDKPRLKKAIQHAKQLLEAKYKGLSKEIYPLLDEVYKTENFLHNEEGIGIFIAPGFCKKVKFDFPVEEKISVGEQFEIRELLLLQQETIRYFLLEISHKHLRLFKGHGEHLTEISNSDFPMTFTSEWNYLSPSRGHSFSNSLKNTEGDKSITEEKRFKKFLQSADQKLNHYLKKTTPLFISGGNKETGFFKQITHHERQLAGIIDGNYRTEKEQQKKSIIADEIKGWQNMVEDISMNELSDAFGKRRVAGGIEEVWHALVSGMGETLFVERDFQCAGFISDATGAISRKAPKEKHRLFGDIIDYIMSYALDKNIRVILVGNNKLYEHDRIALLLHYRKDIH